MNISEFLIKLSQISQSTVKFLFASKWTFWIIGGIIVLYLIWRGLEKSEKESIESSEEQRMRHFAWEQEMKKKQKEDSEEIRK